MRSCHKAEGAWRYLNLDTHTHTMNTSLHMLYLARDVTCVSADTSPFVTRSCKCQNVRASAIDARVSARALKQDYGRPAWPGRIAQRDAHEENGSLRRPCERTHRTNRYGSQTMHSAQFRADRGRWNAFHLSRPSASQHRAQHRLGHAI